ncbi:MAG: hypothetical protein H0V51_03000 [Chloroflexi bacterium]|nr:hypothetical protein [Chloroflexota bacterium]
MAVTRAPQSAPSPTTGGRPRLSVVIASVNGGPHLDACLAALARQRGNLGVEVVVVDGRGDGAPELVTREFPTVRVLPCA